MNFMALKKLDINPLFNGFCNFVKEQFKCINTWIMIFYLSVLGGIVLGSSIILIIVSLFSFFSNSDIEIKLLKNVYILSLNIKPFISSPLGLIFAIIILFIFYKIIKKSIGLINLVTLNALAACQGKELPRFNQWDERLSFILLFLLLGVSLKIGTIKIGSIKIPLDPMWILYVKIFFSYAIMLDEKCSPLLALKKSWKITRGIFWPIFLSLILIFLISSLVPILNFIFIIIPVPIWFYAYFYTQFKQ